MTAEAFLQACAVVDKAARRGEFVWENALLGEFLKLLNPHAAFVEKQNQTPL